MSSLWGSNDDVESFRCLKKKDSRNCYSCPTVYKKDCKEFWSVYAS
jgi:hypothetical protein